MARRPCWPRLACSTEPSSGAACSATATSNSSAFSMLSNARSRPRSRSTRCSTTMPLTSTPRACPRESGGAGLARAPQALDLPLHAHLRLLAQRGREFLFQDHPPAHPPWRLPFDYRPPDRHQRLSDRAQCQSQTVRLDQIRRRNPYKTRSRPCTYLGRARSGCRAGPHGTAAASNLGNRTRS